MKKVLFVLFAIGAVLIAANPTHAASSTWNNGETSVNMSSVGGTPIGTAMPVVPATVATPAAITTPASSASSVTILAANANRNGFTVCNSSTAILYLAKAATATTSSYTVPFPAAGTVPTCYMENGVGVYRGIITGIWASANGNAIVTEW